MADSNENKLSPVYPPETLPTVFVDGVQNLAHSSEVVKFYLNRLDPSLNTHGPHESHVVAQVVMPMQGFVATALFFHHVLMGYVEAGIVDQALVDQIQAVVANADDDA